MASKRTLTLATGAVVTLAGLSLTAPSGKLDLPVFGGASEKEIQAFNLSMDGILNAAREGRHFSITDAMAVVNNAPESFIVHSGDDKTGVAFVVDKANRQIVTFRDVKWEMDASNGTHFGTHNMDKASLKEVFDATTPNPDIEAAHHRALTIVRRSNEAAIKENLDLKAMNNGGPRR